jgi:hypothetical protein
MSDDLVAAKPKSLTDDEAAIARLMVFGLQAEETIDGKLVKADWPLTLEQAARFVGYRCKKARNYLDNLPEFSTYRRQLLEGKRKAEAPRNLATLIEIRDDPGEGFAADRTVRIKAVAAIEGRPDGPNVTVNVNQQTNVAQIQPGYVIRLPALKADAPAIEQGSAIDRARARGTYDRRKRVAVDTKIARPAFLRPQGRELYGGDWGAPDRYTGGGWAVPGPVSGIFGRALNPVTVTLSEGRQRLTRTCPRFALDGL